VRVKALLSFLVFIVAAGAAAQSADALPSKQPVGTTQLVAWLTGGVSSSRLASLVAEDGLASLPTRNELRQIESAGADKNLMRVLSSGNVESARIGAPIPEALLKAAAEARQQHFHEAAADLHAVVGNDAQNSALHFALGVMYRQQEQWDEAFDELSQATRIMPDLPENHGALAYLFYRLDDGPNAIAEARTALSLDPNNAEGYQFLGLGLYSNGQYQAAVHAYAESLARDPGNADTYYDMGIALHATGNLSRAIAAYERAIRLRPAFWEAHSNRGLILHEEGNLAQAVTEYREAKRIAPGEASVRNNLGNTYCDQGKFDSAIEELNALYREHPEWQQGHACLASAYMAKKNYDAAVDELRLALQQNPTGSTEHRILGQALLLDNKPEEALREFRLAVSLNPDSEVAHHLLGTALFQQQQVHAAEKEFREALRLNGSADNHYSLAACLMSLDVVGAGNGDSARSRAHPLPGAPRRAYQADEGTEPTLNRSCGDSGLRLSRQGEARRFGAQFEALAQNSSEGFTAWPIPAVVLRCVGEAAGSTYTRVALATPSSRGNKSTGGEISDGHERNPISAGNRQCRRASGFGEGNGRAPDGCFSGRARRGCSSQALGIRSTVLEMPSVLSCRSRCLPDLPARRAGFAGRAQNTGSSGARRC
jgi:tetratricopeptide (TPR) repeat protein